VGAVVAPAPPSPERPELPLTSMNGLFLAPGIGAQGYTPLDVAQTFAACPDRVMPSASRSLLAAGPDPSRLRETVADLASKFR
jgi:orotidine-5'-phosphate decarboxylase